MRGKAIHAGRGEDQRQGVLGCGMLMVVKRPREPNPTEASPGAHEVDNRDPDF